MMLNVLAHLTKTGARRLWRVCEAAFIATWCSFGFVHSGYILDIWSQPATPQAHAPFNLNIELRDPQQVPVADHQLFLVFEHPQHEPLRIKADEREDGLYRSRVTLPAEGGWHVTLLDDTHGLNEELATLELILNADTEQSAQVVVPPSNPGTSLLRGWLWGLVGLVLLAGLIMTMVVYRKGRTPNG